MRRTREHFRGCLLGGAVGDALGWPVEFERRSEILRIYGQQGITDLVCARSGKAEITDDTQMTLFTAEGLLRAISRGRERGIVHEPSLVHDAYLRWLHTQGDARVASRTQTYDGWLLGIKELHASRAPGGTCLTALRSGKQGTMEEPLNDSKGCGGVMRVAPVGLLHDRERAFQLAAECAALTHGHPSGYLSAGALAHMIAALIAGEELAVAVEGALRKLQRYPQHEECAEALQQAMTLAKTSLAEYEAIRQLGEGWVGEEALAIAVYCCLKHSDDLRQALVVAVSHDGDSDSTGAIAGNLLGACLGEQAIPSEWLAKLELREVISQMADDLYVRHRDDEGWLKRYPGY